MTEPNTTASMDAGAPPAPVLAPPIQAVASVAPAPDDPLCVRGIPCTTTFVGLRAARLELEVRTRALLDAVERSRAIERHALRIVGTARLLAGLTEQLHISAAYYTGATQRQIRMRRARALRERAAALYASVQSAQHLFVPVELTHPEVLRALEAQGASLREYVEQTVSPALVAFLNDPQHPEGVRREQTVRLHEAVIAALDAIAQTPHEATLANVLSPLVDQSNGSPLGRIAAASQFVTSSVGALPGPDALSVTITKLVVLRRLPLVAAGGSASLAAEADRYFLALARATLPASEHREFHLRTRIAREFTASPEERALATRELEQMLGARLQSGRVLSSALVLLNALQLWSAFCDMTDPNNRSRGASITAFASSAVGTAGGASITLCRVVGVTAPTFGATPTPIGGLRNALRSIDALMRRSGTAISVLAGVSSLVSGLYALQDGISEGDSVVVVVGSLQISAGLALTIGVLLDVPLAEPFGVLLGLVSVAISMAQPPPARVAVALRSLLARYDEDDDARNLTRRAGVEALVRAVRDAVDDLDHHGGGFFPLRPVAAGPAYGADVARATEALVEALRGCGFNDADARRLIVAPSDIEIADAQAWLTRINTHPDWE